ncbi:MAG: glycine cleavage system aminomethyltransferase GcvT [Spongiibacteraceae bacterium]|nr:glycine cleavage system aminomethyltransferase GcvT [Spongiibacteraceae bacterium]
MSTSTNSEQSLKHTPLHDLHIELRGKMVPFTGYSLPVQYTSGIIKEHTHTRQQAGLFDVSHMGQIRIKGPGAATALEALVPIDVAALATFKQSYAVFTNEQGGILDDLIITRWGEDDFFLVLNAACKEQDVAHLRQHLTGLEIEILEDRALLALQGPKAHTVIEKLAPQSAELTFMNGCWANINTLDNSSAECFITRSGYTGEDGFEISIPAALATQVAKRLLSFECVKPIGLGARDSLRLEAGLCLYGHDMDENTTPIEAGLTWSISKSRRSDGEKAGHFLGAQRILEQMKNGTTRKRLGFIVNSRIPVREGADIINQDDKVIGKITSGGFAPTLSGPIAMGYAEPEYAPEGTQVFALVRGKKIPMTLKKMPFVKQTYVR